MSLYIHYEFIAVDRPLDREQLAELSGVSTRAEITPSSFTNHYDWGDLRVDPATLMARYFDAGLRWTSAGDRVLWLRLPYSRATHRRLKPYASAGRRVGSSSRNSSTKNTTTRPPR